MQTPDQLKELVRQKYGEIAAQEQGQANSCCGSGPCSQEVYNIMSDDYATLEGYAPDADLNLGCGLPTQFAKISPGQTVIDLGSGAGNDCFVARHETGPEGRVIGIDFTPEMIARARQNAAKLGYDNVTFREGDIEDIPVADQTADVVVSNCVLNLVPNKTRAFQEIYRVLKPGGHFSISDVVIEGALPVQVQQAAEMYAGCVSGAIQQAAYLDTIRTAGFEQVTVQKLKPIFIPDDILLTYLTPAELAEFRQGEAGIYSLTVFASRPGGEPCCTPGGGCC
ncbi:MAG: arsenite methyltransferase [Bacteroidia bacterium]|nr:arsenite methyltransferase [Bacteroidia bacterium]